MRYLSIAGALIIFASTAAWADPVYTPLNVPGAKFVRVTGVNAAGYIAGYYYTGKGNRCEHHCGFVRAPNGKLSTFKLKHTRNMVVNGITASATVFGDYFHNGLQHFIRTKDGEVTTFQVSGGGTLTALNDEGTAVGWTGAKSDIRSFVRTPDGTLTLFRIKGCAWTTLSSINATGVAVGTCNYLNGDPSNAFIRTPDGAITTFSVSFANKGTTANVIDDNGSIAGGYSDASVQQHAYIRDRDGTFHAIDIPNVQASGYEIASIVQVGDDRQVIGSVLEPDFHWHGFIRHDSGTVETFDISSGVERWAGTFATGASSTGIVAGWYTDDLKKYQSYIRTP